MAGAALLVGSGAPLPLTALIDRRPTGTDPDRFEEACEAAVRIAERAGPREGPAREVGRVRAGG